MNHEKTPKEDKNDISPWHSLTEDEVLHKLSASQNGLTPEEVQKRIQHYGPNVLPPPPRRSPLVKFLIQFHNVLIYVLLGAAITTALLADWVDAAVILGVVVINAVIGFVQEGKAEKAVDAIRNILSHEAMVLRDGRRVTIKVEELVPGDVVLLQSGDKVPADLRLFKVKDLRIEEAALTGESVPVEKSLESVAVDAPLGDHNNMAFSGTLVSYGQGSGIVVATGEKTELGKVSALLSRVETLKTRLTSQMDEFSQWLTGAILILAVGTLIFGLTVREYSFTEIFFASVALAVAAIPEGLPAIITITMALGVQRMANRNAIIRSLPAVETLGSVTVICSDKTGTLTRNEMTVTTLVTAEGNYKIDGVGYDPKGGFTKGGQDIIPSDDYLLSETVRAGVLCNDGSLAMKDGVWQVQGDPTDGALITMAIKAGQDPDSLNKEFPRIDTIPFESEHKFMATLHHDNEGQGLIYLKGAPERVLEVCSWHRLAGQNQAIDLQFWKDKIDEIARQGQRTLAVATLAVGEKREITFADVKSELTLLGLVGLIDPPREEAIAAVKSCRNAGITVKMITGDHGLTATAIGHKIGLETKGGAVTGQTIETMDDDQLQLEVQKTDIFARVSPEHKLRLVTALQANDQVVSMTGDGINDAPALKRADVGVAMGMKGTEAAKEAAEMVLADDNFASIAHAVEEGRTVYDNIKKTLAFILPTNGAQAGIIIASVMMGIPLPITPLQILWINMVTAVTLGLSLAFEPPEGDVMRRPPRLPGEPLLTQFLVWRIMFISAIMVMGTLGLFLWDRSHGETLEMARTTAVNTLIFFQIFYLFNARYLKTSVLSKEGLLGSRAVLFAVVSIIAAQFLFTYLPLFQNIFGTASIPYGDWTRLLSFTILVFILVEIEKVVLRHMEKQKESSFK
ncbi:MAG: cation-transporting P-type ATPase [Proteobacteria bacterium]|nr:cation-transporting P-type ATPase [Pseudomonadota bacterium]MBU1455750.1 cation-transporting P-type ATPase [Pseudomonadota bacterium]